jgi:hypothetical protein
VLPKFTGVQALWHTLRSQPPASHHWHTTYLDCNLQVVREGRVDVTLELPGCACCLSLVDCRQGGALLGMQDESGGKDIVCALDNGEVQVPPPLPLPPFNAARVGGDCDAVSCSA